MTDETETVTKSDASTSEPTASGEDRRLSEAQWLEIEEKLEFGSKAKDLAVEYSVTPSAISQRLSRRRDAGVIIIPGSKKDQLKKDVEKRVAEKEAERLETFAAKKKIRIEETRERGYIALKAVANKAEQLTIEIVKGATTAAAQKNEILALGKLARLHGEVIKDRLIVLQADNEVDTDDLPELTFRDLTAEEIKRIQNEDPEDELSDQPDDDVVEEGT